MLSVTPVRNVFAHAADATPDCSGADEAFEVLRAIGFLASHAEKVRSRPNDVGPNVRANVEEGQRYSAADVARAQSLQTVLYHRWQAFFKDFDVILTPSITIIRPYTASSMACSATARQPGSRVAGSRSSA